VRAPKNLGVIPIFYFFLKTTGAIIIAIIEHAKFVETAPIINFANKKLLCLFDMVSLESKISDVNTSKIIVNYKIM
jgi:hypothetical protein